MRFMRSDDLLVTEFPSTHALPPQARNLLEQATGFYECLDWWNVVQVHAIPPCGQVAFITIDCPEQELAIIPALRTGRHVGSLTTPYTCSYTPLITPGLGHSRCVAVMAAFVRHLRPAGIVRLDALPEEWGQLAALEQGARRAGTVPLRFDHFGNWHEDVTGLDWATYLQRRPSALRETIRRRLRRAEKRADARFKIFTQLEQMPEAAEIFESVYRLSWKETEPYPTFNVALMQATATMGLLRFGVWYLGTMPVAVQFWTLQAGRASVLKLAHNEAFKADSPGTVLTALMVRYLLNVEHVEDLDFGRGDDAYKQGWAMDRRQRIGLLLVNPWHLTGMAVLLQHLLGRIVKLVRQAKCYLAERFNRA